ncbi:MAG: hypothetical protein AABW59_02350 [archaeon]
MPVIKRRPFLAKNNPVVSARKSALRVPWYVMGKTHTLTAPQMEKFVMRVSRNPKKYEKEILIILGSKSEYVVEGALQTLQKFGKKYASRIAEFILDPRENVQIQALASTAYLKNSAAIPLMKKSMVAKSSSAYAKALSLKILVETFGVIDPQIRRIAPNVLKTNPYLDMTVVKKKLGL